jgi:hypothetical protein
VKAQVRPLDRSERILFDDLVCAQLEFAADREPERRRGFQIDDQPEFAWLFDEKIGRFRALQNFVHIAGRLTEQIGQAKALAIEPPDHGITKAFRAAVSARQSGRVACNDP